MARIARLVVPGYPHHVTQRGNRRQRTFFGVHDYETYIDLIAEAKQNAGCEIWAYCLMPNHVHFVVVPQHKNSLAELFREAHRRYTRGVNLRENWRGHLWQERFHSVVMDEPHLSTAVRYVELNPVSAGLCSQPESWRWSSIHAHLNQLDDELATVEPMLKLFPNWVEYLESDQGDKMLDAIRKHTNTGRPLGSKPFIKHLETITGCSLTPRKRGPKTN